MKKTLLYLILPMLFSVSAINAQTTIWDFGTDTTNWPVNAVGYAADTKIQGLGIYPAPSGTTIGQVDANAYTFTDNYVSVNRFKMGGNSAVTGNLATARYLYFNVTGSGNVKIWFRSGSNSATRTLTVSDGTNVLGSASSAPVAGSAAGVIFNAPFTNLNGKIYIYNDAACYIYKIEVTGTVLGTNIFSKESDVVVYTKQNKIFLSNLKSKTQVNVYNVLGALVKTAQVDADSSLDINSGVYIVNAKSAEGEKSVKVIVQ
jgi:hypothetical protein